MSPTLRLIARRTVASSPARSFTTYRPLFAGKESELHSEGRAEEAEAAKQDQLKKAQATGKGEYKDTLASDSESIIKADRGEHGSTADTIKELQKEGEKLANKK
ncbi:hypothetical protein BDZ85DRAFT_316457 [Elsinoe ampelina]|uniref:Uncharacterized protein n=1 Tax=Elsinoe ampelina TaxID=302913 RepID=A0A6A6GN30_9PEZI|nr:hypothetical protein BDZ85DRAFT_316457 [Elsinoe ampelina]